MHVLVAIKKARLNKIIIENRTNLVSHPYYIVLDIKEHNSTFGKYLKKTTVVNFNNNKIDNGYI